MFFKLRVKFPRDFSAIVLWFDLFLYLQTLPVNRQGSTTELVLHYEGSRSFHQHGRCNVSCNQRKRVWRQKRRLVAITRELTKRGRRRQRGFHFKIRVRVIHITMKLFHVVSRLKCVVTVEELNWYEWVGIVERELQIHRHVLTSSTEP